MNEKINYIKQNKKLEKRYASPPLQKTLAAQTQYISALKAKNSCEKSSFIQVYARQKIRSQQSKTRVKNFIKTLKTQAKLMMQKAQ